MAEREATVGPEEGLHGRPAAQFVKTAKQFSSDIVVEAVNALVELISSNDH